MTLRTVSYGGGVQSTALAEIQVDAVMRVLWESRTQRKQPWTDAEWERVRQSPIHRATLRMLEREAVQMIEDGEFDE